MNNDFPFILYKNNKTEFLKKVCALCLTALYYPETGNTMTKCLRLGCKHTFHQECLEQMFGKNHVNCPECRESITSTINVEKSLELTIRNDAFEHDEVDADLLEQFKTSSMVVKDYPYHKIVFERWKSEVTKSEVTKSEA